MLDDTEEDEDATDDNAQRAAMTKERISRKRVTSALHWEKFTYVMFAEHEGGEGIDIGSLVTHTV